MKKVDKGTKPFSRRVLPAFQDGSDWMCKAFRQDTRKGPRLVKCLRSL
jgi:hypothetical protein